MPAAEATRTQVSGHPAVLLRDVKGAALVWRCDRTTRLFRLVSLGPRAPEIMTLAARARCHDGLFGNGDVPAIAAAALGPDFHFANRGRGSISYVGEGQVLTLFAGQSLPPPHDASEASRAAPAWLAAAGLSGAKPDGAEPLPGPQSHPGIEVHGAASLEGRPVRWTLLFWRCLQRQLTFTAVVFGERAPDPAALRAARCHG
jgi:hypothetical protein